MPVVQHRLELVAARLVARDLPGLALVDPLVRLVGDAR